MSKTKEVKKEPLTPRPVPETKNTPNQEGKEEYNLGEIEDRLSQIQEGGNAAIAAVLPEEGVAFGEVAIKAGPGEKILNARFDENGKVVGVYSYEDKGTPTELEQIALERARRIGQRKAAGDIALPNNTGDTGRKLAGEKTVEEETVLLAAEAKKNREEFNTLSLFDLRGLVIALAHPDLSFPAGETKAEKANQETLKRKSEQALAFLIEKAMEDPFGGYAHELKTIHALSPSLALSGHVASLENKANEMVHGKEINEFLASGGELDTLVLNENAVESQRMAALLRLVFEATHDSGEGRKKMKEARDGLLKVYNGTPEGSKYAKMAKEILDTDGKSLKRYKDKVTLHHKAGKDIVHEFAYNHKPTEAEAEIILNVLTQNSSDPEQLRKLANATRSLPKIQYEIEQKLAKMNKGKNKEGAERLSFVERVKLKGFKKEIEARIAKGDKTLCELFDDPDLDAAEGKLVLELLQKMAGKGNEYAQMQIRFIHSKMEQNSPLREQANEALQLVYNLEQMEQKGKMASIQ